MTDVTVTLKSASGATTTRTVTVDEATARFPGDPGPGKLFYGLSTNGGDPTARENYFGTHVGAYRSYYQPTDLANLFARAKRDLGKKRLPLISSKVPATWGAMANGSQDAWIDQLMSGLATAGGPVWFCPHHEPYDDTAGAGSGMTPADYKAMCVRLMKRKAPNVAIMPILQSAPFDRTVGGSQNIADWYSADSHDIFALDAYNHWSAVYDASGNMTGSVNKWRTPADVFSVADQNIWGKPVAFMEYGVRTDPRTPGKAAQWMTDARNYLVNLDNCVAMSFFDSSLNVNDGGTPWSLDDHGNERLDRFKVLLNDPSNAVLV